MLGSGIIFPKVMVTDRFGFALPLPRNTSKDIGTLLAYLAPVSNTPGAHGCCV